jgi:hypothetical protein
MTQPCNGKEHSEAHVFETFAHGKQELIVGFNKTM